MKELVSDFSPTCPFKAQSLHAHVLVLPMTRKDQSQYSTYYSIPLINLHVKNYSKIKVPCLQSHMDQVGCVQEAHVLRYHH